MKFVELTADVLEIFFSIRKKKEAAPPGTTSSADFRLLVPLITRYAPAIGTYVYVRTTAVSTSKK